MATDSTIQVRIIAEAASLKSGMAEAAAAVTQFSAQVGVSTESAAQAVLTSTYQMTQGAAAAAASIGTAMASIGASMAAVAPSLAGANAAVVGLRASFEALQNVAIIAVLLEVANKLREVVAGVNESEVALLHMSERTGVSISDLHGMSTAFEATGASASSFERAMRMIEMRLQSAAMGSASARDKFAALGINWQTLRGLAPEEVFFKVADAVSNMKDSTEKAEAIIGLLGARFGTQLIPALNLGSAGLRQIIEDENKLNPITQQAAEESNKLHVQWLALGEGANSLARAMSHELRAALGEVYTEVLGLGAAVIQLKVFFSELSLSSFDFGITKALKDAAKAGQDYIKTAQELAASLAKVGSAGQVEAPDVSGMGAGGKAGGVAAKAAEVAAMKAQEVAYRELGDAAAASEQAQVAALNDFQRELKATTTSNVAVETSAAKTVETMYAADFALQRAQIEELSKTHVITAQQAASQLTALDQRELASKLLTINTEIAALQTELNTNTTAAEKIAALKAQAYALMQGYAAKDVTVQTKAALETEQAWTDAFSVIGDNMSKVLDIMVTGSSSKTNTMKMQFMNLAQSIEKEMLSSGLKQILMGGGPIIGTKGMLGGIAGEIANAFSGSAVGAGLKGAMTTAWTGLTGVVGDVFGGAWRGIAGIIHSVFGTALQGVASAGAGAAASTGVGAAASGTGAITTGLKELFSAMTMAVGYLATMATTAATHLAVDVQLLAVAAYHAAIDVASWATTIAQDAAYYAESLIEFIEMVAAAVATAVKPSFLGFTYAGGGIVPSAAGGMVSGGGLSILHPKEMVLPAHLSEGVQNAINGGTLGGGGGTSVVVNFTAHGTSAGDMRRHADLIGNIVAQKVRDGRMTGQGVNRGAFRR